MPKNSQGLLVPGTLGATRAVPPAISRPEYVGKSAPATYTGDDTYDAATIDRIRSAARIAAGALDAVGRAIAPGMTTDDIDAIAHDYVVSHGAYPSTLGYRGYP